MKETEIRNARSRGSGLVFSLVLGLLAGACFNIVFGSEPWSGEGILGGLISALLVYITS